MERAEHDVQRGRRTRQDHRTPGWFDLNLETDRHSDDAVLRLNGIPTAMARIDIVHLPLSAGTQLPM
jgi:hypothetical protein